MADKVVKIVIRSDVTEGVKGFENLTRSLDGSNTAIKKFQTTTVTSQEGLQSYIHTIELAANKLKDLRTAEAQARTTLVPKENSLTSSTYDVTAQARAAAKERETLAKDIAKAEVEAAKIAEQAEKLRAKSSAEAVRELQAKRQASAAIFKQETSDVLNNLDQRLTLEQAKRIHGANSNKVLALKAAQEEYNIRKRLASDLLALEESIQQGANRGRVNAQRAALVRAAGFQIDSVQGSIPKEAIESHRNLATHILEIIGLYRIMNFAINTVSNSIKAIPQIGIQLESTIASLTSTVGSEAGAASAMKGLNEEAKRTGITIDALRTSFRTFQASTSLAGESLESTWRMFTNINTVATALHLTTDQTNGVFLALAQIFNKTKVQSEELVKQLGNLLPGAFASFAAANRDMFKNSAELIAKMKLGVVTAHDTVEKFTAFMAGRFQEAFNIASLGLNANVGRMQTSFTLLGEAIYGTTRGPMLEFVKAATNVADYLTEAVKGTNNFAEVLKQLSIVGFAALTGSIVASIVKLEIFTVGLGAAGIASKALTASLAFFSSPAVIIAGITAIAIEISRIGKSARDAEERVKAFFKQMQHGKEDLAKADKIKLEVDAAPAVQATKDALKDINETIKAREETLSKSTLGSFTGAGKKAKKEAETQLRLNYVERANLEEELERQRAIALESIQLKNAAENAEALDVYQTKRTQLSIAAERARGNEIAAARMQVDEQYKALVEKAQKDVANIEKTPVLLRSEEASNALEQAKKDLKDFQDIYDSAGQAKSQKSLLNSVKGDYKQITEVIQTAARETEVELARNDKAYNQNLISLKAYLEAKKEIIDREFENKSALQRGVIDIATNVGDTDKIKQAEEEIQQLKAQHAKKLIELEDETYNKKITNIETLRGIEIEYYTAVGNAEKAFSLQFEDKYGKIRTALQRQIADGDTLKQTDLDRLNALERLSAAETASAIAKASLQGKLNLNAADQERVNVLRNIGAISELTAATQLQEVYKEQIALKEELIRVEEDKLAAIEASGQKESSAYVKLKGEIDEARTSLESFRLSSNTVGQYFQTQLTPAFTNAFTGFIIGSMSAKEAFRSFATDILKRIADIAAQELAAQIIGGLVKGAGNLFGGGGVDAFGANATGRIVAQAAGGVNTGMGGGNGYVLTSPTYFPSAKPVAFASGGVLAGEAGAEAVLPLKRTSNGKLGVETTGASQGGDTYYISVSVEKNQNETPEDTGNRLAIAMMKKIAQSEIANANRPGNQSNKITTFG